MILDELDYHYLSVEDLEALVNRTSLPRHVAIIMDGNGRWASQRGFARIAGHREGVLAAREAVNTCSDLGISALTLYAFSLENWKRPQEEISMLMDLFCQYFQLECERFLQEKIRIRAIGRLDLLPLPIQRMVRELEEASRGYDRLTVTLALSYGGRAEIIDAVKKIVCDAAQGSIGNDVIDEGLFSQYLDTCGLPDPDLLIRTSGESRVSNFLLWQIAYAELYFTKTCWPEFGRREFLLALLDYQKRERRLGGLKTEQGAPSSTVLPQSRNMAWDQKAQDNIPALQSIQACPNEVLAVCSGISRDSVGLSWLD